MLTSEPGRECEEGTSSTVKLTVERLPESQVRLDILAEDAEFADAVDRAAKKVSRDITVPGFRKGHVPRHMIERMYGREIFIEEAGRLMMDDLYKQAIDQEKLTPVGNPEVNITQLDPIGFSVEVPVYPTVDPGDWKKVRIDPEDAAVAESEVDEVVERLRKASSPWVDAKDARKPRDGDQVSLDLSIFEGEEPFQDPIENAQFIIGESQLFEDLKEAVTKLKPGETGEAMISFAEDDEGAVEKLRGKSLKYVVTLKDVKERELLEIDDEFAKTYAGEESADDLLAAIRKDLHQGKTTDARNRVLNQIIDQIAEGAAIEIPAVMVEDAVTEEIARSRQRLQMQRTSLEAYLRSTGQSEDEFKEELRPEVARRLRNSLVLREIAEREGIAVTDEEVSAEIEGIVAGAPNPEQMEKVYSADRYMRSVLRNEMYDERLSNHLIEVATGGKGATLNGYEPGSESEPAGARKGTAKASGKKSSKKKDDSVEEKAPITGSVEGTGEADCPEGYPIKGNASSKIYHMVGQGSYENTIPEICFATEADAEQAGYRASKSPGAAADAGAALTEAAKATE
jgi:trigger factor